MSGGAAGGRPPRLEQNHEDNFQHDTDNKSSEEEETSGAFWGQVGGLMTCYMKPERSFFTSLKRMLSVTNEDFIHTAIQFGSNLLNQPRPPESPPPTTT